MSPSDIIQENYLNRMRMMQQENMQAYPLVTPITVAEQHFLFKK
jgi:hypothetical protein